VLECAANAQVLNNVFYGNQGGMCINSGGRIANNTISNNSGEGIYISDAPSFDIHNNIISDNNIGIECVLGSAIFNCNNVYGNTINYRGIADPTGQNGNISVLPQYCLADPATKGDYSLQSDSPCVPGNHPDGYDCGFIGAFPVGCGATAIYDKSWGIIKSKFK
jgi:parallel beta-helix repeat protein